MLVQIIHSQGPQCFLSIHHLCNTGLILTVQKQFAFETAVHHSTIIAAQRQLHSTCRNIRNRSSTQLLPQRQQTVLTRRLVPARQCAAALLPTLTCHWSTAISGLHCAVFLIGRAVGLKENSQSTPCFCQKLIWSAGHQVHIHLPHDYESRPTQREKISAIPFLRADESNAHCTSELPFG